MTGSLATDRRRTLALIVYTASKLRQRRATSDGARRH